MPTGPKGEKRPADVIGNAVKVMKIAVGKRTRSPSDNSKQGRPGSRETRGPGPRQVYDGEETEEITQKAAVALGQITKISFAITTHFVKTALIRQFEG